MGTEANDLPYDVWELGMLNQVGQCIEADEIATLPKSIEKLLADNNQAGHLRSLRDQHIYNYMTSGEVAAKQLLDIQASIQV